MCTLETRVHMADPSNLAISKPKSHLHNVYPRFRKLNFGGVLPLDGGVPGLPRLLDQHVPTRLRAWQVLSESKTTGLVLEISKERKKERKKQRKKERKKNDWVEKKSPILKRLEERKEASGYNKCPQHIQGKKANKKFLILGESFFITQLVVKFDEDVPLTSAINWGQK